MYHLQDKRIICQHFLFDENHKGKLKYNKHLQGIGVHSIISTAEKHNGSCRFSANEGVFSCTVIMDE